MRRFRAWADGFFFTPDHPTDLGWLRIGLFGAAALFVAREDIVGDARSAAISWKPTSFFRALAGPPGPGALRAVQVVAFVSAALVAVGLLTRVAQVVATPAVAFVLGFDSNFGKINHRSMLVVLLLLAVWPARLGDGVSLDRLIAAGRTRVARAHVPHARYRWPVALAQVTVVSVYVFAGLSKIVNGGPAWFSAESFQRFLYVRLDQLADPPGAGLWLAARPALAQATAVASVVFELSVAAVLVVPLARRIVIPLLVAFHESTRWLTRIDFTRTLAVAWLPLVDWRGIGLRVRARIAGGREPAAVLYDGSCGLCRRSAAVLWTADALHRLEFVNARDDEAMRTRFPGVDPVAALDDMHLVEAGGRVAAGFEAYRRLAALVPLGWPVLPLLHAPGVGWVGRKVYRRVADSRLPVLHCAGGACRIDHEHPDPLPRRAPVERSSLPR